MSDAMSGDKKNKWSVLNLVGWYRLKLFWLAAMVDGMLPDNHFMTRHSSGIQIAR